VVPKSVASSGYSILNADDDLVYQMKDQVESKVALFSGHSENPRIRIHVEKGGIAAWVEDQWFIFCRNSQKQRIMPVTDVPLTFNGTAACMIMNILPAIISAFICKIPVRQLHSALLSFKPSPENTPGRMNQFDFSHFMLMIDYAHNEGGYQELKTYAAQVTASIKTGVIAATGDRREQDISNLGSLAAEIFDELIIRHDKDGRGRTNDQITGLLLEGIKKIKPKMPVTVISDEIEAINYAVTHAQKGAWIFVNTDNVNESLAFAKRIHQNYLLHNSGNNVAA
jgi:cyanophycin synthetase